MTTVGRGSVSCRVCNRPLRNLVSISEGVGPVCRRKVRQALQEMLDRVIRGEAEPEYTNAYAMSPEELQNLIERDARQAYLQRGRRPSATPVTVEVESSTRGRREEITVEWIDRDHAHVRSQSGNQYMTTENACNCPDYVHRRSRNPELAAEGCRHMQAMRLAREEVQEQRRLRRLRGTPASANPVEVQIRNRDTFRQIDWTVEDQREQVLETWKENRPHEGTYISRDQAAWNELKGKARSEWEYKYENVLGGTGNSFGVEMEVEFRSERGRQDALDELHERGYIYTPSIQSYHSTAPAGYFRAERDGSLGANGVEIVSPKMHDDPDHWRKLEEVTEILRRHGATTSDRCGGHIHVGIAPLDHRTYSWQRLGRIGLAYEKQFYRMGGADSERFRSSGQPGKHRGTGYARNLSRMSFGSNMTASQARSQFGERRTIFNTTNIDNYTNRPALEMRYPNGSIDHRQIQAQIQLANAVVHQAAVIRNNSKESEFTPRLSEYSKHLRQTERTDENREEQNFREFLDVVSSKEDRLAATWLWLRGRA